MKLKTKPVKPVRNIGVKVVIENYLDLDTLSGPIDDIIRKLENIKKKPGYYDIEIEVEYGYDTNLQLVGRRDETLEEFAERLKKYNVKLKEYETWYAANKDAIEQTVTARKQRAEKKKQNEIANLEKRLKRLRSGR